MLAFHLILLFISSFQSTVNPPKRLTSVSIINNQFFINGQPTYKGRNWNNYKIEGLLMNSRMVQGIFDDENPKTKATFIYNDTKTWDPNRNTNEFISNMPVWKSHGLLAFTLNMQGGSPLGYGNNGWLNSAFHQNGKLKKEYINRLEQILTKADELGMVVILGYFYFGQDQHLLNEKAVINATDNITNWILKKNFKNIIIEINNECDIHYDHAILKPDRIFELIQRVKSKSKNGRKLLVSTSFSGGKIPTSQVVKASDFVLLHANGVSDPNKLLKLIANTRHIEGYVNTPIIINEDDHFEFNNQKNNFITATENYVSWGYFDYRMKGEGFENGFQSVPVDWSINSPRKKGFFEKLKEITGY